MNNQGIFFNIFSSSNRAKHFNFEEGKIKRKEFYKVHKSVRFRLETNNFPFFSQPFSKVVVFNVAKFIIFYIVTRSVCSVPFGTS